MPSISHSPSGADAPLDTPPPSAPGKRPFLGIYFECCRVYARVYRRPDQNMYVARCPQCLRAAKIRVGHEGCRQRIFTAR
jgi:hypothetical protein